MSIYKVDSSSPASGVVRITARGIEPIEVNVNLQALETISFSSINPSTGNANVGESITFEVTGTSNPVSARVTPDDGSITCEQDQHNQYLFRVTSTNEGRGNIYVKGDTTIEINREFTYLPADNLEFQVDKVMPVTMDKEILVTVTGTTKNITASSNKAEVKVAPKTPLDPTCKEFIITAIQEDSADITFSGIGVNSKSLHVEFRAADPISLQLDKNEMRAGDKLTLSVTGADATRTLRAVSSDPCVTTRVISHEEIELSGVSEGTTTITVSGDYVETKTVKVKVYPAKDTPSIRMVPDIGQIVKGSILEIYLENTISEDITAIASVHSITVNRKNPSDATVWLATSQVAGQGEITFEAPDINTVSTTVEFLANASGLPPFTVDQLDYTFYVNEGPLIIPVKNLYGELFVKSSHPKIKADVEGSNIKVYATDLLKEVSGKLTLTVEDQDSIIINIKILPEVILPKMACDGTTKRLLVGETGFISIPLDDGDDNVSCSSSSQDLTATYDSRKDGRVTFTSSVEGNYVITIKHAEYQPAKVNVEVYQDIPVVIPTPPEPDNYYDLGIAPEVTISQPVNGEVSAALTDGQLTTDSERISWILVNGTFDDKIIAHSVCNYSVTMDPSNGCLSNEEGAKANYSLYNTIKTVIDIEDYYSFKERFRLLIRLFKFYNLHALNTVNLMRYDEGWIWGSEALNEYRSLISFLTEYVRVDGQSAPLGNLPEVLEDDDLEKIRAYVANNIRA